MSLKTFLNIHLYKRYWQQRCHSVLFFTGLYCPTSIIFIFRFIFLYVLVFTQHFLYGFSKQDKAAHTVLATAKFTSFSLMPQNENANFHARKRIILKTKAQIRKFITANETPNARKQKHANESTQCKASNARKRKHANESMQTKHRKHTHIKRVCA